MTEEQNRPTSTPPEAKLATAVGAAMTQVVAQLTELLFVAGAAWLRSIDKLSEDNLIWVLAALVGPAASKIRGVKMTSTAVTMLALLPVLKKSLIAKMIIGSAIFLFVM